MRILDKIILCGFVLLQTLDVVLLDTNKYKPPRCPTWPQVSQNCTFMPCEVGICYTDLDVEGTHLISKSITKANLCCERLNEFCPSTKMHTFHNSPDALFGIHKAIMWNDTLTDKKWYHQPFGTGVACPIPYSYDTINFKLQKPEDFNSRDTEQMPNCTTNADCVHGREYCGQAYSVSYNGIDQSNNGTPMMFCYELPYLIGIYPFMFTTANKREIGPPICNYHDECFLNETCYILPGNIELYAAPDDRKFGFCVNVEICYEKNMTSFFGVRISNYNATAKENIDGFCETDEQCREHEAFTWVIYTPRCTPVTKPILSIRGINKTIKVCCYEIQPRCDYGYILPGDIECNTTADCNEGKAMGNWVNWCDSTGVCCTAPPDPYKGEDYYLHRYSGGPDYETYLCPDYNTFLFAEEPCIDVNISDTFSGKCPISDTALCKNGHCCPDTWGVLDEDGAIVGVKTSNTTYISNQKCNPAEMLPYGYFNAYCDIDRQTVITVSESEAQTARDKDCEKPSDCDEGETCIRFQQFIQKCFKPFKLPITTAQTNTTPSSVENVTKSTRTSNSNFSYFTSYSSSIFSECHIIIIGYFILLSIIV